ncbi:hypothetical protein F4813DRAFT_344286 [Daldinia decipiens]|uniref:uncharacterized protein n=1 Tax=Daldinia decipiens TaxID=326647 RepID=UPI0020C317B6|nr:uncharacterized protein F4813DRAFT_344286 [Daldinia decipiens]KAI1662367.1 hypothetical protein F4813DRAFT_344286 [Daldinia decipiens]
MDHANLVKNKSAAGYFGNLPIELIQDIMCRLHWKNLKKMILLSSPFLSVFQGAQDTILYNVGANEMGADVFEAALVRYACTVPALRNSLDIEVKSRTRPIDTTLFFNGTERIFNTSRFRMPAKAFTIEVFREIMSFHEKVAVIMKVYEKWLLESHAAFDGYYMDWVTDRTPREKDRPPIAVYTVDIARLLYPDDYKEALRTPFVVKFEACRADWVIVEHQPNHDPPFAVSGQSLEESQDNLFRTMNSSAT